MRVTIMGLGRFGGGLGAAIFYLKRGDDVLITDRAAESQFGGSLRELAAIGPFRSRFGEHREEDFEDAELIVASPAVPVDHPLLSSARARGTPVTTELEVFCRESPAPMLAVTGSNGKTTTCHLTAGLLETAGRRVALAGNMGRSLLPELESLRAEPSTVVVVEISSFQLEYFEGGPSCFQAGLITGVAPNHLDRHGSFERYRDLKRSLISLVAPSGAVVVDPEDASTRLWRSQDRFEDRLLVEAGKAEAETWVEHTPHRIRAFNLAQAKALAEAFLATQDKEVLGHLSHEDVARVGASFAGLPHRLEEVASIRGRRFINDSKSTTPEATAAAIDAFAGPVVLIAGGFDKKLDPGPWLDRCKKVRRIELLGETAPELARALAARNCDHGVHETLPGAFDAAVAACPEGGTILFSPGHASFGLWPHYEARGEAFRDLVQRLL